MIIMGPVHLIPEGYALVKRGKYGWKDGKRLLYEDFHQEGRPYERLLVLEEATGNLYLWKNVVWQKKGDVERSEEFFDIPGVLRAKMGYMLLWLPFYCALKALHELGVCYYGGEDASKRGVLYAARSWIWERLRDPCYATQIALQCFFGIFRSSFKARTRISALMMQWERVSLNDCFPRGEEKKVYRRLASFDCRVQKAYAQWSCSGSDLRNLFAMNGDNETGKPWWAQNRPFFPAPCMLPFGNIRNSGYFDYFQVEVSHDEGKTFEKMQQPLASSGEGGAYT